MSVNQAELARIFSDLTDEVLIDRLRSGALTEEAKTVARRELFSRGVDAPAESLPAENSLDATDTADESEGDMVTLVVNLAPTEAHILQARLDAEDIYAIVADAHLGQVGWALPAAGGGARVLVAERHMQKAKDVLAQLQAGKYRLEENEDEAAACPRCGNKKLTPFIPGFFASLFKYSGPAERLRCDSCGHTWPNSTSSL